MLSGPNYHTAAYYRSKKCLGCIFKIVVRSKTTVLITVVFLSVAKRISRDHVRG